MLAGNQSKTLPFVWDPCLGLLKANAGQQSILIVLCEASSSSGARIVDGCQRVPKEWRFKWSWISVGIEKSNIGFELNRIAMGSSRDRPIELSQN
jgi:hypothetical protein